MSAITQQREPRIYENENQFEDPLSKTYDEFYRDSCVCCFLCNQPSRRQMEKIETSWKTNDVQGCLAGFLCFRIESFVCPVVKGVANLVRGIWWQMSCVGGSAGTVTTACATGTLAGAGACMKGAQHLAGDNRETVCLTMADSCKQKTQQWAAATWICQKEVFTSVLHLGYDLACYPLNVTCPEGVSTPYTKGDIQLNRQHHTNEKEFNLINPLINS